MKCIVLPAPTVLSAQILPPINSTKRFEMAKPRPVPPYLRVVETSACEKLSKMVARRSAGIPMPVSETEKCSASVSDPDQLHKHGEFAALGEFGGVAEQIQKNLPEAAGIADQARWHIGLNPAS